MAPAAAKLKSGGSLSSSSPAGGLWWCFGGRSKKEGKQKLAVAPAAPAVPAAEVREAKQKVLSKELVAGGGGGEGGGGASARAAVVKRSFSVTQKDYKLLEEVGTGASATVFRAEYIPTGEIIAVKCLDLDRCNSNLDDIRREAQTMSLIDHSNIVKAHCSFVVEHHIWVVMPFMEGGSCLHLMKLAHPDGFDEVVICSILKETLKALEYLHGQGHIHRDVKAGNILLDSNGEVKLCDFGVSAGMFNNGDRQRSRNTFVGTPCWMAPEVLQPESGYDFKADIWSFGITALELAHGHAPFSKYPPMKVLLMTLQSAPPGLDYERDRKFSKSFKEMVAMCLVKDQTKRPTAAKLLNHSFFKNAKPPELCLKKLLVGLPPLWDRVKALQLQDAAQLALKKMPSTEQEALSQSEYQRGVSAWNFDIEDLKAQAALIQDDDNLPGMEDDSGSSNRSLNHKDPPSSLLVKNLPDEIGKNATGNHHEESKTKILSSQDALLDEEFVDYGKNDDSTSNQHIIPSSLKSDTGKKQHTFSGRIIPDNQHRTPSLERESTTERIGDNQSTVERQKRDALKGPNFSGPLMLPTFASGNSLSAPVRSSGGYGDLYDDKPRPNIVQIKGRFSVTSENVDLVKAETIPTSLERDRILTNKISELQARINFLNDELAVEKLKTHQLEQQLNDMEGQEGGQKEA